MLVTSRLRLLAVEPAHREAFARGTSELAATLRAGIPQHWPQFPHALAPLPPGSAVRPAPWGGHVFIHEQERMVAGNGGFKGPPDAAGVVEIGYEVAPAYRGRGLATEAVKALVTLAFLHEPVTAVCATTLAQRNASNSVLRKLGMRFAGESPHPALGGLWRWTLSRADHLRALG